jgi:hypothetical protein
MFVVASLWFSLPDEKLKAAHHNYTVLEERVKSRVLDKYFFIHGTRNARRFTDEKPLHEGGRLFVQKLAAAASGGTPSDERSSIRCRDRRC